MNIWERLEISETKDLKLIKKAYAERVKLTIENSDDNEFQSVKEAYDVAIKWAKSIPIQQIIAIEKPKGSEIKATSESTQFTHTICHLMSRNQTRIKLAEWKKAAMNHEHWNVEEYIECRDFILRVLMSEVHYLPRSVINYLFTVFNLNELTIDTDEASIVNDFLLKKEAISVIPNFSFLAFTKLNEKEIKLFCDLRYQMFEELSNIASEKMEGLFCETKKLFSEDSDVLNMYTIYLVQQQMRFNWTPKEHVAKLSMYVEQAKILEPDNEMVQFLDIYCESLFSQRLTSVNKFFLELEHDYYLSATMENFMLGYIYYYTNHLLAAYESWRELPPHYVPIIRPELSNLEARIHGKSLKKLNKAEMKFVKTEKEASLNWPKVWMVLVIIIIIVRVIVSMNKLTL